MISFAAVVISVNCDVVDPILFAFYRNRVVQWFTGFRFYDCI